MTNTLLILKKIFFLTVILFTVSCTTHKEHETEKSEWANTKWINFEWVGDSLGNKYFDKVGISIPITFKGIPHKFNVQFDLGSDASVIYGNSFKPYLIEYPEFSKLLDTSNTEFIINNEKQGEFKNIEFSLDSFQITLDALLYYKNYGEKLSADSIKSTSVKHIGTVGADIAKNKILVIDYPNKKIAIVDSLNTAQYNKFDFFDCRIKNGRVIIPLTINGKVQWYLFDTGASVFSLVTDEDNWKSFCDTKNIDTLNISSWGTFYSVYGANTNKDIYFNKTKLPETRAYMMTLKNYIDMFKQEDISGVTGNAYFLNNVIALDFKNSKFGVMTSPQIKD